MAMIVHFQRTTEDATQVEYASGPTREEMSRRLVVDKATKESRATDDRADGQFRGAATQMVRRLRADGAWPERGLPQA
jgi:hypothetical protein